MDLGQLLTEQRNPVSAEIDTASTVTMLEIINSEDQKVAVAVAKVNAEVVAIIPRSFCNGPYYLGF